MKIKLKHEDILYLSIIFLLISVSISSTYIFGISNHTEQIPVINRVINSSYLHNDWFVNQNSELSPRFWYAQVMGFLGSFINLPELFFYFFIISTFASCSAIFLIGKSVFNNAICSLLTITAILFFPQTALGGNWIHYSIFLPATLAMPFALFGLYFFLENKYLVSFGLLGLSTLFHPLIGLLTAGLFILYFLVRRDFKNVIKGIIAYSIVGLIGLFPVMAGSSNATSFEIFNIITRIRHRSHYCPFSFPASDYLRFFTVLALFGIILVLGIKHYRQLIPSDREKNNKMVTIVGGILLYCIIGTLFVEIIPLTVIGKLELFRMTPFISLVAYFYIFNGITLHLSDFINTQFNKFRQSKFLQVFLILIAICFFMYSINILIHVNYNSPPDRYQEMYSWIQKNTPEDSVFIIPPQGIDTFRLGANRAIVIDWKAFPFRDDAVLSWYQRMDDVMPYSNMSKQKVIWLKQKYMADYIVIPKDMVLEYNQVYNDKFFRIYKI